MNDMKIYLFKRQKLQFYILYNTCTFIISIKAYFINISCILLYPIKLKHLMNINPLWLIMFNL